MADVCESSYWQDSVITEWIADTVKNLLSLVDSLEDDPCAQISGAPPTEIGSGNNHRQQ
jgi:hypothetical protein